MKEQDKFENDRAFRILIRIRENHLLLASIYENLVDREFQLVERDAKIIIMDI